jgi:ABC-2 type transport system permease protein
MNSSFFQLLVMNFRLLYRNRTGLFFTLAMPVIMYVALSILPIGDFIGSEINYSDYVLPGIIAMTIMQGGIYGLAYWFIDLKSRNVIKRFLVTPLRPRDLIGSVLLSRTVVAMIQVVLLTAIGWLFFNVAVGSHLILALGFTAIGAPIFLLMGLLISTFADSYEAAAPITTAIGLPLTFLGNIFFPVTVLPQPFVVVAKLLPIMYLSDGIRSVFLNIGTWSDWGFNAAVLMGWLVLMSILTAVFFRLKPD